MLERRIFILVAALVVLLASAGLWNTFVPPPPPRPPPPSAPPPGAVSPVGAGGPSYIVLLARSEIRRRIRASAGSTYLNDIVGASSDSVLHRWDGRVSTPVRVFFPPTTVATFQPSFLDAVRSAFQRWQEAGVPVRFNLDADSGSAEVQV